MTTTPPLQENTTKDFFFSSSPFRHTHKFALKLRAMAEEDQRERIEYAEFVRDTTDGDYEVGAKLWAKDKNRPTDDVFLDKDRQEVFMHLLFNFEDFNNEDWENYWILSQHCDLNRDFQSQALENIKKYLGTDNEYYYCLHDRIESSLKEAQNYLFVETGK